MISLCMSHIETLQLDFDNISRFSMCRLSYKKNETIQTIYEDYLYVFIEEMLGRVREIPVLNMKSMFGQLGKWQEYYYFDFSYNQKHCKEIEQMRESILMSTVNYGLFLYQFGKELWLELDKGYCSLSSMSPYEYYDDSNNYRMLLLPISKKNVQEWKGQLELIEAKLKS